MSELSFPGLLDSRLETEIMLVMLYYAFKFLALGLLMDTNEILCTAG